MAEGEAFVLYAAVLLGYLLGSIPSAYVAGQLLSHVDIRQHGDGNAGAANAFTVLGPLPGITVGLVDVAKGVATLALAQVLTGSQGVALLAGLAAVLGHNWPIWIGFRGGRGEATTIGILLYLMPAPMLAAVALGGVVFGLTRNVIAASAVLFISMPLFAWLTGISVLLIGYGVGLSCLVGATHFLRTQQP